MKDNLFPDAEETAETKSACLIYPLNMHSVFVQSLFYVHLLQVVDCVAVFKDIFIGLVKQLDINNVA